MKEIDDYKRILGERKDKKLAGGGVTIEIVRTASHSSISRAALYKKNILAALQR